MGGHALGRRGGDPHLVKDVRVLVELAVDELVERQRLDNVALKHDRGEYVVRRVVVEAVEGEVVRVALRVPAPRLIEGASCRRRLSAVAGVVVARRLQWGNFAVLPPSLRGGGVAPRPRLVVWVSARAVPTEPRVREVGVDPRVPLRPLRGPLLARIAALGVVEGTTVVGAVRMRVALAVAMKAVGAVPVARLHIAHIITLPIAEICRIALKRTKALGYTEAVRAVVPIVRIVPRRHVLATATQRQAYRQPHRAEHGRHFSKHWGWATGRRLLRPCTPFCSDTVEGSLVGKKLAVADFGSRYTIGQDPVHAFVCFDLCMGLPTRRPPPRHAEGAQSFPVPWNLLEQRGTRKRRMRFDRAVDEGWWWVA